MLHRCGAGGDQIEALDGVSFWRVFKIIFSYEQFSSLGPPMALMGNPDYTYDNKMWSLFLTTFKAALHP